MVVYLTLDAVAGPQACLGDSKQAICLSSLSSAAQETARSRSALLQAMYEDTALPFPECLVHKWLAVAAGGDCDADEAVDVLRVAAFLQDEHTYARLISTVSARMATGFEASLHDCPSRLRCLDASFENRAALGAERLVSLLTVQPDDGDADCLEVLKAMHPRAACMHPHDRYRALGALPLPIIARLPEPLQLEAISSRVAATATPAAGATVGSRRSSASSSLFDPPSSPPPAPALVVVNIRCCDIARVVFRAAFIPTQPLSSVSIIQDLHRDFCGRTCASYPSGSGACCASGGPTKCCPCTGAAISTALCTHAASLRHFTLVGVSLTRPGAQALAAALIHSPLRLKTLALGPIISHEIEVGELAAAVHTQTALTQLSLTLPWVRADDSLDLSNFPRLRKLAVIVRREYVWERWLARELGLKHLQALEELDLSRAPANEHFMDTLIPAEIAAGLRHCPALRTLSVAGVCIPAAMHGVSVLPELTCMRVCLAHRRPVLSMAWLGWHTQLREIVIAGDAQRAWRVGGVDVARFAREAAALRALTRVEMCGVRAVNCCGGWALGTLMRALEPLPCLEVLRLSAVDLDSSEGAARRTKAAAVTESQRRWLRIFEAPPPQRSTASPQALAPPVERFPALRVLDLSANGLTAAQLSMLASMSRLTHLDLAGSCLGADLRTARGTARSAQQEWLEALAQLARLRYVNLAWNDIDDDGALRVLWALRGLRLLEVVDLGANAIRNLPERGLLRDVLAPVATLEGLAEQGVECACAEAVVLAPVATWEDFSSVESAAWFQA